jgi:hypothetical protein
MNIEPLESRIAPAALTGRVLTYTDTDGDRVTITFSKGSLDQATFTFDTGSVDGTTTAMQQLQLIDLHNVTDLDGTSIMTKVTRAGGGDGLVNIGRIDATGHDLGSVTVKGDLGGIDCGDPTLTTMALKTLTVRSMGLHRLMTQGGTGDLHSTITGPLGALKVSGDVRGIRLMVNGGTDGTVGSIFIGGSLIGDTDILPGSIYSAGGMKTVTIQGSLVGGTGSASGAFNTGGTLNRMTIGGSIIGGSEFASGGIQAKAIGTLRIGHDLIGGSGSQAGEIVATETIGSLFIGGSLHGGAGNSSGLVFTATSEGDIRSLKIVGSLVGGTGFASGQIQSAGGITAVTIGHDLLGSSGSGSGVVNALGGGLGRVTIGGDFVGGSASSAGGISATQDIGQVVVRGSLIGGSAQFTGRIASGDVLGGVMIGGSVIGGAGQDSASIKGGTNDMTTGDTFGLGPVKIGGDLVGGLGRDSARIATDGALTSFTVRGSIIGVGSGSGQVISGGAMGPVKIGGDLRGGGIAPSGADLSFSGYIQGDRIASVTIGGSIIAGADQSTSGSITFSASIRSLHDIGPIAIKGSLIGRADPFTADANDDRSLVVISASGQSVLAPGATTDTAIAKITIGGSVIYAKILAGFDAALNPSNADASIGAVKVGGQWAGSDLVAGAYDSGGDGFGFMDSLQTVSDDAALTARIASITIRGEATSLGIANFGFVAQEIGKFSAGGRVLTLHPGPGNDDVYFPLTQSVHVLEV